MPDLDCHDVDTALRTLASAIGVTVGDLSETLLGYDDSRFSDTSEAPYERMPREVLSELGTDASLIQLEDVYYFHGTRVVDPNEFLRRGILPFPEIIEQIWRTLYELLRRTHEFNLDQWNDFRRSVESKHPYNVKAENKFDHGPNAFVVRELLFHPGTARHDYLACPEIVQDIARFFRSAHGVDLEERFCSESKACIVKFRSSKKPSDVLTPVLWYLFSMLRTGEVTENAEGGFAGEGILVPPEDVIAVEVIP
jgi:hypothetical protein